MSKKLLLCALLGSLTALSYGEPEAPAAAGSEQSSQSAIEKDINEYTAAVAVVMEKFKAQKDQSKATEIYQQMPASGPYIERVLTEIEKNPKDPAAQKGLVWSLKKSRTLQHRSRVSDLFEKHFVDDPVINEYARSLMDHHRNWQNPS